MQPTASNEQLLEYILELEQRIVKLEGLTNTLQPC